MRRRKQKTLRRTQRHLATLIDEARKGREVILTDRGKPVARLVPLRPETSHPFPDRAAFRRRMPILNPPLSETIRRD